MIYFLILLQYSQRIRSIWMLLFLYILSRCCLRCNTLSIFCIIYSFGEKTSSSSLWVQFHRNCMQIHMLQIHALYHACPITPCFRCSLIILSHSQICWGQSTAHIEMYLDGTLRKWTELLEAWSHWFKAVAATDPTRPHHGHVDQYHNTWVTHLRPTAVGKNQEAQLSIFFHCLLNLPISEKCVLTCHTWMWICLVPLECVSFSSRILKLVC